MWSAFVGLLSSLIQFFYELTKSMGKPNYGLAIIMFTVTLRVLMFPLNLMQAKSTKGMSLLQPQLQKLQQQYKNDPAILNRETSALYKKYKLNPLTGCLPLLIQMPILFALFSALRNFDYAGEGTSFFWLKDLTLPDATLAMPIIVGFSSYLQSKLSMATQPAAGTDQAKTMNTVMLYGMPVMMAWMTRGFASGLAIYWSVFNILGFLMQIMINAMVNRSHENLKAAIEADEKKEQAAQADKEDKRRTQKEEAKKKAMTNKNAAGVRLADKKRAKLNQARKKRDGDNKGQALDFDDYS